MDASPTSNRRTTFLGLPTEVRLKIYEILMISRGKRIHLMPFTRETLSSQTLRACRQIHREALSIMYGQNTFFLSMDDLDRERQSLGDANMAQMSKLTFDISGMWSSIEYDCITVDVDGAASSGIFNGLSVLDVLSTWKGEFKDITISYLVELFWFLKRLVDDPGLPRLQRMSTPEHGHCRLTSSQEPMLQGESIIYDSGDVRDLTDAFLVAMGPVPKYIAWKFRLDSCLLQTVEDVPDW